MEKFMAFMMLNGGFYPVFNTWFKTRREEFATLMTIFSGHASYLNGQWVLKSGTDLRPVQQFVDEYDGRSMLILLLCCNPENHGRITAEKSLVVHSRSSLTLRGMESRRSRQIMHVPGYGDFIGTTDQEKLLNIARQHGWSC
jgi:hypothetical protein